MIPHIASLLAWLPYVCCQAKLVLYQPDSQPAALLLQYVLSLSKYDADYDLRDRARLIKLVPMNARV